MDINDKNRLKGELQALQGVVLSLGGMAAAVAAQGSMPVSVMGNVVIIPSFQVVSQALQAQKDAMQKMVVVMEKILEKV